MNDELDLFTDGLDQSLPFSAEDALKRIEEIVQKSVQEHNAEVALRAMRGIVKMHKLSGITLAKGLYLMKLGWSSYNLQDTFDDLVYVEVGLAKATVDRYVNVWAMKESNIIPGNLQEQIMQRNIKDLIPIATALKQGHDIDAEEWEKLAEAPDFASVGAIVREITGRPPRSGSLQLSVDKKGTIWVFKDGSQYFAGSFEVDSEDEPVQQAIERFVRGAGALRK